MPLSFLTRCIFLILFVSLTTYSFSQDTCTLTISGKVTDEHSGEVLEYASVLLKGTSIGTMVDSNGNYELTNLCPGEYIIQCSHIGCISIYDTITLTKSITLNFYPEHHTKELKATIIKSNTIIRPNIYTYQPDPLFERKDIPLQNKLKSTPSVSLAQTGARISKPMVWGLYGNRLGIVQDGVIINDQQWGQDHAPAIDNNARSASLLYHPLKYSSETSAGIIDIISNRPYSGKKSLGGIVNRYYSSNGKNIGSSFELNATLDSLKGFRFNLYGDYSRGGDLKAPHYYLTNTGAANFTLSTIIGYKPTIKSKWDFELGIKNIRRENGVLQAAHIGNITDLKNALNSDTPLIVKDFSYEINNPRQVLSHDVLRLSVTYFNSPENPKYGAFTKIDYAYQDNTRKEFDIRRAGREGIPALDLNLQTHYLQVNTTHPMYGSTTNQLKTKDIQYGFNLTDETNINNPNTGIRPLIPNYESIKGGIYFIQKFTSLKNELEYALRYETKYLRAIKYNYLNELNEYTYNFNLPAASINYTRLLSSNTSVYTRAFYGNRSPGVNELFSEGLHQSVASIEEGDTGLKKETSVKLNLGVEHQAGLNYLFKAELYAHTLNNYIQIEAEDELRQTIQGAFPVFKYKQTDALLLGASASFEYTGKKIDLNILYRYLQGQDLSNHTYLSFMPNNVIRANMRYNNIRSINADTKRWSFKRIYAGLSTETVFKQKNYPKEGIITPPPATYTLVDVNVSYPYEFGNKTKLSLEVTADNIFNTEYRDYMDRLRYFAALPGRNILFNLRYNF